MPRIEITELFLAKADWKRTYVGTVTRDMLDNGSIIVHGKIPVEGCVIEATATNDKDLGKKLDELVVLILDHKIMEMKPRIIAYPYLIDKYGDCDMMDFCLN